MKQTLEQLLCAARDKLAAEGAVPADAGDIDVQRTRDPKHGDFSCNLAMTLAAAAKRKPREIAALLVERLPASALVDRVEIAGPGFINFFLKREAWLGVVQEILSRGEAYGRGARRPGRVLLEFVSANPTGPLHVGHGRQAAFGATLFNLLSAAGFDVEREYYINDAGRQVDILAVSTWLRYLERCGETIEFPSNGYRGDYLHAVAERLHAKAGDSLRRPAQRLFASLPPDAPRGDKETHVDALIERARELIGADGFQSVLDLALEIMLADIREDLKQFGVEFDHWYSERSLETSGAIDRALDVLRKQGRLFMQDGATWFRAAEFGDEKDRVVVRENGQKTYFASDIAYHFEKRERGFDRLIDVLGADHHGYVARVRAGLSAMGYPGECLDVVLIQFVNLFRGTEKVPMGKREAQFVTLRDLRSEVGNDACRFFYLMRSHDQTLDFDLELAKSRSNDNPVFYIQYAHARICSVFVQLHERGLRHDCDAGVRNAGRLAEAQELALITAMSRFPEVVEEAALSRMPHQVGYYLRELANHFHSYYNSHQILVEDAALRDARLNLISAVRQVLRNGLGLLGVSAPESM
jgi:arginyl-tRNA synthetase